MNTTSDSPHSPIAKPPSALLKLSPCPFDGGDAYLFHNGRCYVAKCSVCRARIDGRIDQKQEVIDAWSRRSSLVLEELEAVVPVLLDLERAASILDDDANMRESTAGNLGSGCLADKQREHANQTAQSFRNVANYLRALIGRYREPK